MKRVSFFIACLAAALAMVSCASSGGTKLPQNLASDYSEVTVSSYLDAMNVTIQEKNTGASYVLKLTAKNFSQTVKVPNGDYLFSGKRKYDTISHGQTIPLRDNKAALTVGSARAYGSRMFVLEEYVNLHSGESELSEIVLRNDDNKFLYADIDIIDNKSDAVIYTRLAAGMGNPRTVKVLDGDYTIRVRYHAVDLPSKFDPIKAEIKGERITMVFDNTFDKSPRELLAAASSVRMESRVLIVTGGGSRGRVTNDALDALVAVLYEDLSDRIRDGLRLAMLPMNHNQGVDGETADYLTENLTLTFFNSNKYEMLERQRVSVILAEQNFQMSGNVDNTTAVQAGKLLGADAIMVANVEGSGDSRRMMLRALDVGTGRILGMTLEQF